MALTIKMLMVFLMTAFGSFGALCFKLLSNETIKLTIKGLLFSKLLYIGGCLYVIASVFNVVLLKYVEYSIVYPLSALTYIWTLFISRFILREKINWLKIIAIVLIFCGVTVINL